MKPTRHSSYRVAIDRSQNFEPHEKALAQHFVEELSSIVALNAGEFQTELLQAIPRRVVASHLGGHALLRGVLERLETWSSQTYEGQRIVAAIGILPTEGNTETMIADFWDEDFAPVLSNGFDTLLEVSSNGCITALRQLDLPDAPPYAPFRLRQIAAWAASDNIAASLNRHGEILVFKDQQLRFLRRHGRWSHYSHEANVRRLSPPKDRHVRQAVYESCLDVSFARSGGCIGIVARGKEKEFEKLVSDQDKVSMTRSFKTKLIRPSTSSSISQLDRRLRQELLSLDGAVILDYQGYVLAIGAIIEVPPGSVGGGGRLAAAKQLSSIGVGVKISEDGSIVGFRDQKEIFRA